MLKQLLCTIIIGLFIISCNNDKDIPLKNVYIESVTINGKNVSNGGSVFGMPVDSVVFQITFSSPIDKTKLDPEALFISMGVDTGFVITKDTFSRQLNFKINRPLNYYTSYTLYIAEGEQLGVKILDPYSFSFVTELDPAPKFPIISDDSLLTLVQKQTFAYFWDHAHPTSGLARERYGSAETVTSGGSGFGIMTIPVAIERGFITRQQGFGRLQTIVNFLHTKAERFHGAYPHWLNGTSGKTVPFSTKDNGADLVETAFLIQGLLAVQQYFNTGNSAEKAMCDTIQKIWEAVEWSWFQQNGQQKLFWHWSPNYNWEMNMPISGWNEGLIVYVLAASSPTYPITKSVYDEGWARNGAMKNGRIFYDIKLPLGEDRGGPLFFTHYSFLGLDPRNLSDQYANYMEQNIAHARINHAYCVANPKGYYGYGDDCWGLTASDIPDGYTASSPNNDRGTIAPTAALSSFPYTPEESMRALKFFYYTLGDSLWGTYGFRDAFNLNKRWFASSYLAIDQGPIVVMIENHRTGLLWNLFMQNEEVRSGMTKLGFSY
ncbi:MAG: glucoamylase family protein [Paludibacter sp.]|nr:glucoamylase family protein [Paludibacter sp.]